MGGKEAKWELGKGKYMHRTGFGSTVQSVFVVQQAVLALDALEGIVGRALALLVEAKVVLVCLFILELLDVSPDNYADV